MFVGYDPRQPIAAQVAAHSIAKNSTKPVAITRLQLAQLPLKRRGLTEFTFSRWLVPWLCDYQGYAAFIDSDFVVPGDISELFAIVMAEEIRSMRDDIPVWVSKNKLRFEWASFMVFRNENCRALTPEFVGDEKNSLFDFGWAGEVGSFPAYWNHLVGYDEAGAEPPRALHYTQGIPCWPETKGCAYAGEWLALAKESMSTVSFEELMGRSVHVEAVRRRLAG